MSGRSPEAINKWRKKVMAKFATRQASGLCPCGRKAVDGKKACGMCLEKLSKARKSIDSRSIPASDWKDGAHDE